MTTPIRRALTGLLLIALAALPYTAVQAQEDGEESASEEEQQEKVPTSYYELDPAFVTHVGEPDGGVRYVKAGITLRVSGEKAEATAEKHDPRLRHEIVMALTSADFETIRQPAGQETLRQNLKKTLNEVLETEKAGISIREVLFTTFVVQQ